MLKDRSPNHDLQEKVKGNKNVPLDQSICVALTYFLVSRPGSLRPGSGHDCWLSGSKLHGGSQHLPAPHLFPPVNDIPQLKSMSVPLREAE